MAETTNNVPKTENTPASPHARRRFEGLRREIGSLVEDFFGRRPSSSRRHSFLDVASRRARATLGAIPVVHLAETDKVYEITSELPGGMGEKDVEVKFAELHCAGFQTATGYPKTGFTCPAAIATIA